MQWFIAFISRNRGSLLVLAVSLALLFHFYSPVLLQPDSYLLAPGADGLKTYFTLGYHLRWDAQWSHFGGMNYPFGEVINYGVGHPVLALLFGKAGFVQKHFVAVVNLFVLLSFILAPWMLYLTFRKLNVEWWLAVPASLGLFILNPQTNRLDSHLDLAHSWALPAVLLLLASQWVRPKWHHTLLYIALSMFFFFIHAYLGLMISATWCGFQIAAAISQRTKRKASLYQLLAGIVPVGLFMFITSRLDTHIGRGLPGGFMEMIAHTSSILTPHKPPMQHVLQDLFGVSEPHWETHSYIGLASLLMLTLVGLYALSLAVRRRWFGISSVFRDHSFAFTLLFASLPILWFAMGYPFEHGFRHWLYDKLTLIGQFRAPGRFTWVFYYAAGVLSAVMLNQWVMYMRHKNRFSGLAASVLAIAALSFYGLEGWSQLKEVADTLRNPCASNSLRFKDRWPGEAEALKVLSNDNFHAIVTLPYFHIGSENFGKDTDDSLKIFGYRLALFSGLPLCNSQMSRTSYTETWQQVQLWYEALEPAEVLKQFAPEGKVLILARPAQCNPAEKQIISLADSVAASGNTVIYKIPPSELKSRYLLNMKLLENASQKARPAQVLETFDEDSPQGKACGEFAQWRTLCDVYTGGLSPEKSLCVSFWLRGADRERVIRQLYKLGIKRGEGQWQQHSIHAFCHDIVGVKNGDALVEYCFTEAIRADSLRIELFNDELPRFQFTIDNVLVRNAGDTVGFVTGGIPYLNNRPWNPFQ